MATPKELRQAIIESRADLAAAIVEAANGWENKPASGEGEDAWSPQQVAQHVIGSELFFANGVSQACGAPELAMQRPEVETASQAAATLIRFGAIADNIHRHVSDGDLPKKFTLRVGEMSVEQMLDLIANHERDHANQIRAAAKG